MKRLQCFMPQSRSIKKNSDSRYIVNFLVECKTPEQHVLVLCIDEDKNTVEHIIELDNSIYCCLDYTDFMILCNSDNKSVKKINYKVYTLPNPNDLENRDLETHGFFTLYDA